VKDDTGQRLIDDLLADPPGFDASSRGYDLLKAYFAGLSLETLRPLLKSDDVHVQRVAAFVASELGIQARSLVDDVIPLLSSGNRYLQYHALEVLTVCCKAERAVDFAHVARALESDDDVLRVLAMRLISNAQTAQLEAAQRAFDASDPRQRTHGDALRALAAGNRVEPGVVLAMIRDANPLVRRYGAIAAKRLQEYPNLMTEVGASDDADLGKFYQSVATVHESETPEA
jgi:hypothetical protein